MTSETGFARLELARWRQFERVDVELHPRLTVLTGANGAGKSTLLNVFSRHFGFATPLLATPKRFRGGYRYLTDLIMSVARQAQNESTQAAEEIGRLVYRDGGEAKIQVPPPASPQYNLTIVNQHAVPGLSIGSHRPVTVYQRVENIPTQAMRPPQAFSNYNQEVIRRYQNGHSQFSPMYRMKESLISMATFGAGNAYVQKDDEVLGAFRGFVKILRIVLPKSLGFEDIAIRTPDVVMTTSSGEFMLDAASGGIATLIDLAWQLFLFSLNNAHFVVTIDEPENHLHPSMQRSLMGSLLEAFPMAQFIVATHSPFIVSAVRDSGVYVLRYEETQAGADDLAPSRRVSSLALDNVNKAGTASEILRDVLGVRATMPEWVEQGLEEIVHRYRDKAITAETLGELRSELAQFGYSELYPDALSALTSSLYD